jgi:hypothetical protein
MRRVRQHIMTGRHSVFPFATGALDSPYIHIPIGRVLKGERAGDGLAVWRPTTDGADVAGRCVIDDGESKPAEQIAPDATNPLVLRPVVL